MIKRFLVRGCIMKCKGVQECQSESPFGQLRLNLNLYFWGKASKKGFHLNGDSPRKVSETPEQSGFLLWRPRLPPVASCSLLSERFLLEFERSKMEKAEKLMWESRLQIKETIRLFVFNTKENISFVCLQFLFFSDHISEAHRDTHVHCMYLPSGATPTQN